MFKELSSRLDAIKKHMEEVLATDLAAFNKAAQSSGQAVVK